MRLPVDGAVDRDLVRSLADLLHLVDAVANRDVANDALSHLAQRFGTFRPAVEADGRDSLCPLESGVLHDSDNRSDAFRLVRIEQGRAVVQAVHSDMLGI